MKLEKHLVEFLEKNTHEKYIVKTKNLAPVVKILIDLNLNVFNELEVEKVETMQHENEEIIVFILAIDSAELMDLLIENAFKTIDEGFKEFNKVLQEEITVKEPELDNQKALTEKHDNHE